MITREWSILNKFIAHGCFLRDYGVCVYIYTVAKDLSNISVIMVRISIMPGSQVVIVNPRLTNIILL